MHFNRQLKIILIDGQKNLFNLGLSKKKWTKHELNTIN